MVRQQVGNKNLQKHMLATEAVMRALAELRQEDGETWGLAGLLHDLDYDETADDFPRHGFRTAEMLEEHDIPREALQAIKAHPGHLPRGNAMDRALYAADPVTGLIVAAVLMHPSRRLEGVTPEFLLRRFNEKRFAAGADRDQIRSCSELGISLEDFLSIALKAMQRIHTELGL